MDSKKEGSKQHIGFIGIGHMGSRIATKLMDAGYPLTVYNRTEDKTKPLAQRGAKVAHSPKELAADCEVVMSSLANDIAVEDVMFGPDGALAGANPGTIFIDLSTVYPATSQEIYQAAKNKGVNMIDAAVSGSTTQVEEGTLVILVGGDQDTYRKCEPILNVLSKETYYMGPSGMGVSMKLVVNTCLGLGMQAIAEAIALGEREGLDKDQLINVLSQTGVVPSGLESSLENARREDYPVAFALRLMHKDFGLVLRRAAQLSVPMPATSVAQQILAIEQAKRIEEDFSAVIKTMEMLAGYANIPEEEQQVA